MSSKNIKCGECGLPKRKKDMKWYDDFKICLDCYDDEYFELMASIKEEFKGVKND